jgi:Fe-S cluster biosynthesis and repair protein YggX
MTTRTLFCQKLQREAEGLTAIPPSLRSHATLGQRVYENISQAAWKGWLEHQTRLINEYRLVLAEAKSRQFLLSELEKYCFGGDLTQTGYVPPNPEATS